MSERYLTAQIYRDSVSPHMSIECAQEGIEIVKEIAPWIRIEREQRRLNLGRTNDDFVIVDGISWRNKAKADLNIVLTERQLLEKDDIAADGSFSWKHTHSDEEKIGWAFKWARVNDKRIAIVNTLGARRPDQTVAHEVGHLLGVRSQNVAEGYHCSDKSCLMYGLQNAKRRADTSFCDCCSDQLHQNTRMLKRAKAGNFLQRTAIIF